MIGRSDAGDRYDAVIIGGGIGGLIAAAYLARGRARVLLLEAGERFGGSAETAAFATGFRAPLMSHMVYALDPRAVRELGLSRHGLEFAQADINAIALRPGGQHIVLPRQAFRARTAFAAHGDADGRAYPAFHRQRIAFARRLRPLWTESIGDSRAEEGGESISSIARRLQLPDREGELLDDLSRLSAAAYLDRWFENDVLKAALALDVSPSGLSPHEQGSALVLIWRCAQASCGREAAVSQLRGGPGALVSALETAAREAGAELRRFVSVSSIIVKKRRAIGVALAGGEIIAASAVFSDLDSRETLLGLVSAEAIGFGTAASVPAPSQIAAAQIMLALAGPPPFAGLDRCDLNARLVIAERPEVAAEAKGAALAGLLPDELVIEAMIPTVADPSLAPAGSHVLSAVLPYMPALVAGGWEAKREALRKRAIAALESLAPGLKERIVGHAVVTPDDMRKRFGGASADSGSPMLRLLATCEARIRTPVAGLYLCGPSAEPMSVLSGRAGRLAAALALSEWRKQEATP
jgi:phytoene dehydrogenase-like protein